MAAYELVGQRKDAVMSYEKAGMWRECLNVAYAIPMAPLDIANLANRLAKSLMERREFVDAARLYIDYGKDEEALLNAISALTAGYHFSEAIRMVQSSCVKV